MDFDSDDEHMDLDQHQHKFFDIGKFDRNKVDLDKPAMTVEEHLRQVIVDREQQPAIAVASNYSEIMCQTAASTSAEYVQRQLAKHDVGGFSNRFGPDKEWRIVKSNEFSQNRSMLEAKTAPDLPLDGLRFPPATDSMAWCQITFERRIEGYEIGPEFAHHKGTPPTLGLIKNLNDDQVNHLILHQTEYLIDRGYTRAGLEWIYSLLLVVKKPLLQEVIAALRSFCRKCQEWRAELNEDEMDTIYELSWFIAIITCYFSQRDLAD